MEVETIQVDRAIDPRRRDRWLAVLLALVALVVFSRHIGVGGLRFGDACSHAMDGVLIHDWLRAGPSAWWSPMEFATRQYAHHPTLGIGRVYPPGFAVVEAAFFGMFGVSAVSARLCVVAFGMFAAAGCYLVTRRLTSPLVAVCSTAFFISMPGIVWWTRQTMLEMPTLCVMIWTCLAALRYVEKPGWWRLVVLVGLTLAVPLFKQTGVFLVPVLGLILIAEAFRRRIPVRHLIVATLSVVVPLALLFGYMLSHRGDATHMARVVSLGKPLASWLSWSSLSYYPSLLPGQVGLVVLSLALVGAVVWLRGLTWAGSLPLVYLVVFALMSVLIQAKEPRYAFFGLLPIAMLAGAGAAWLITRLRWRKVQVTFVCALCLWATVRGYRSRTWLEPDYSPLVAEYEADIAAGLVMFEGKRDGDFVFAARKLLGSQNSVVLRGSKLLYSCAAWPVFDYESRVQATADVRRLIDELGIETLFVERENLVGTVEMDLLHEELSDTSRYEKVASRRLVADAPGCRLRARTVDVYKPRYRVTRTIRYVDIPIPIDSRVIRIDLDRMVTDADVVRTP